MSEFIQTGTALGVSVNGTASSVHRVVIVGGGFAGVRVARGLSATAAQVTLIDRTNHHLFQPLLYQVATGVLSPGQIAPALRSLFRHQENVEVMLAEVQEVDLERRVVRTRGAEVAEVPYDTLVLAAGAAHSYFGHDEWSALAPGMKTLDDASRIRSRVLSAFEMAEQESDPVARRAWLTFVIVGAGPTGVELAGQIVILANRVLRGEYRHIDTASARVMLLDAESSVLAPFAPSLRERAQRDLRSLGVEVEFHSPVTDIDEHGVLIGKGDQIQRIPARTVIWAAGVKASPLGEDVAAQAGAQADRSGRLSVGPDLSVPGHPEVFAVGDMIALEGVPGTAQPAIQEGKYVAKVLRSRLGEAPPPKPFHYVDLGMMAVIGRKRAVADLFGRIRVGGFPAFAIWGVIHLVYLVGWGNRFEAVARWMWTILARNRRERLISTDSLVAAETAIDSEPAAGQR